jgi:hypothetical protein
MSRKRNANWHARRSAPLLSGRERRSIATDSIGRGLVFVAVTVGTGFSKSSIVHGTRGFQTPTLIRFSGVFFLTMAVLAPWPSAKPIGIILSLGGLAGLAYQISVIIARHKVGLILLA